jgi:polar amino acid transport system substrate-binding protein
MSKSISKKVLITLLAIIMFASLAFVSCGGSSEPAEEEPAADAQVPTVEEGYLTVATGEPAWAPWVGNGEEEYENKPESGVGYESALVYAIAENLGFDKDHVKWVRTTFDEAIAPGEKPYDFNIQQYSITEERQKAVDFSTPYYENPLSVIVDKDGKFADAKSVGELKTAVFGAPNGDIAAQAIETVIGPDKEVQIFGNLSDVFAALKSGQIDATVQGATTADYNVNIDNKQIPNAKIIGNLPGGETGDKLACLLAKDSPLTSYIDQALADLKADGTIEKLQKEYLGQYDFGTLTE